VRKIALNINKDLKLLLLKIELTRAKLNTLASETDKNVYYEQIIELSQKLDELILEYMKMASTSKTE
jgi:hypothetical protein